MMKTVNGEIQDANLEDWPVTLQELASYYDRAEMKMGVTGKTTGMPHLPWNNDFRVLAEGARRVGYKDIASGPMAINSEDRDGRPALPADRLLHAGMQDRSQMVDQYHRNPRSGGYRKMRSSHQFDGRSD